MSKRIPQSFIDDVIAKTDIIELIGSRITLKKSGSQFMACCPFHNEKNPSFSASPNKQFYYCFGCGAHGNAISFLMQYDRLSFIEVIENLAARAGLAIPHENQPDLQFNDIYQVLNQSSQFYQQLLPSNKLAQDYLKKRGLNEDMIKKFALGFSPNAWQGLMQHFNKLADSTKKLLEAGLIVQNEQGKIYDRFRNRLMFPIRDERGRVIAFGGRTLTDEQPKYLNSPETSVFHKHQELYGLYEARQSKSDWPGILIVEGYLDVIALSQHGIDNAVATLGTALNAKHLQKLLRHYEHIVFCFDGDLAGRKAALRALEICLPVMRDGLEIRFMFLPAEEDPDSLVRKIGRDAFFEKISQAYSLADLFFAQLRRNVETKTIDGKARLVKLAYERLEKIPQGIFKQLMLEQLSQIVGMTLEQVTAAIAKPSTSATTHPDIKKPEKISAIVQHALILLIQNPQLHQQIENMDTFKSINLIGIDLFINILEQLKQHPEISTGGLLELWRDHSDQPLIASLASQQVMSPPEGLIKEFRDVLQRILQLDREQQIQKLLEKAKANSILPQEKEKLLSLLQKNRSTQNN